MFRFLLAVSLVMLLGGVSMWLVGCGEEAAGTGMNIPEPDVAVLEAFDAELANVSNEFGFKVLQEILAGEGGETDGSSENVFLSPTSIYTALAMTYNGAGGETREAMVEVLGVEGVELERFNENNLARLYELQEADPEVVLNIANSLWMRQDMEFAPDFVERNMDYYHASAGELDFAQAEAAETINEWVEDRTGGLIDEMVEHPIDPQTVLFLLNAVYFQGDWSEPFDPDDTREDVFHAPEGDITDVPFMQHQREEFPYLEKEGEFQAVRLPYGEEERLGMYVFLPHEDSSVRELVSELDDATWEEWREDFDTIEGDLSLPRFTLEYEKSLNEILKELGMEIAFDPEQADFYDMLTRDEGPRLFIDEVKHKSFIEVDEKGTEAAAATSVEVMEDSAPMDYFQMDVNRPFVFFIHDEEINEMLFNGAVFNPDV